MPGPEPIQIEHLSSLSFYDDNFVYKNKSYSFDDVVHVKFTATRTQHSVNFVPTGTSFETDLRVVLVAGPVLRITPDRGFLQKEARFEAILRAAEILSEITFTKRMENYESELAEHNFLTWDGRQFARNGDVFQSNEFKFNIKDKAVDARLGIFHLHCQYRKSGFGAALKSCAEPIFRMLVRYRSAAGLDALLDWRARNRTVRAENAARAWKRP